MLRSRCLASLVFTPLTLALLTLATAATGGCSSDDALVSTDSPVPVVVPGTSSAQCAPPMSACVLATSDVSSDTGVAISVAAPGAVASSALMASSQGMCAYSAGSGTGTGTDGGSGSGSGSGSGVTVTVTFYCGLAESTSTAYVDGYKDQVADDGSTLIAGLGDYAVWIPSGAAGSVAALQGNAYVTVAFADATGGTSAAVAQASAAAVARGYLAALF